MRYGSVCSGIEAASVAWEPLGWSPAWFSEIEKFPSAVLQHHWPTVPNHGDMLALPDMVELGLVEAPDVLVGGTPCQSFSLAGRRGSLADERGALTLAFVELANRIDERRIESGENESVIVWENVPGVLNTKDNAFGAFLAGLAGEDVPLEPTGKRWTNAGVVSGPQRTIAWRVLDAQYFRVAQRRRRVFVVASARDDINPAEILLEREGLRRDSPPSREAREDAAADAGCGFEVAGTLDARTKGGGFPGSDGAAQGHVIPDKWPAEIASTLNAAFGDKLGLEDQHINSGAPLFVPAVQSVTGNIAHALNTANNGKGCSEDGTGRGVPTIAFSAKDYGGDAMSDLSPTIRAGGHNGSHANAGVMPAVAFQSKASANQSMNPSRIAPTLDKSKSEGVSCFNGMAVRRLTPVECERLQGFPDNWTRIPWRNKAAEDCPDGPRYKAVGNSMVVPVMAFIGSRLNQQLFSHV